MKRIESIRPHNLLLAAAIASILLSQPVVAQSPDTASRLLPDDTLAVVTIWPKDLFEKPSMQLAPLEVVSAAGLEQIGLDPLQLHRVDVAFGMPGPRGPTFGAVIQSAEAIDINNLFSDMADGTGLQEENGFKFIRTRGPENIVLHQVDSKTVLFGSNAFLQLMIAEGSPASPLSLTLNSVRSEQDALLLVAMEQIRPLLVPELERMPEQLMPAVLKPHVMGVLETTEMVAVRAVAAGGETLQLVLTSKDDTTAEQLAGHVNGLIRAGLDLALQEAEREIDEESLVGVATLAYLQRIRKSIPEDFAPRKVGNRLVLELNQFKSASIVGTFASLMLPAVQGARKAARRMQASNNLKQLGLGLLNFESAYRTFPAAHAMDDQGKPMLSWRVAILPYLEEMELYNRFHMDEPWDSEHNLALLEEMPDVFLHPDRDTKPGYTVYQAAVGKDTILRSKEPTRIGTITDGTSNTIIVVETVAESAVPWTAPQDWEVDHDNPNFAALFFEGVAQVLFCDGSVQTLREDTDPDTLKALLTRSGGEVVRLPR